MEYMPNFTLHRPETVADAVTLKAGGGETRFLAGGTDMVVNIRRGIERPTALIELNAVAELKEIREDADGLAIGAAVTLDQIAGDVRVKKGYAAVAQAAAAVAGPTHRDYGTLGGNLCLDTRCLYYNQSEWWRKSNSYCLKHRGETCHVAPGGKRCFAAFSGDVAPAMLVFDAEIELASPNGTRRIPLKDLYRNDGMDHLTIGNDELLVRAILPKAGAGSPSAYAKARVRGSIDFPLAGAAVRLEIKDGKVGLLRIGLTGVSPLPYEIKGCEDYVGKALDDGALDGLRDAVQHQAKPMMTTTVKPWYRRRVTGALARRLAAQLAEA